MAGGGRETASPYLNVARVSRLKLTQINALGLKEPARRDATRLAVSSGSFVLAKLE